MKRSLLFIIILLFAPSLLLAEGPSVVVSLKPIHSLVSALMQGVGKPELLIEANQSPHTFQLKPSQVEQIHKAQLVIWIGPDLETALAKPIQSIDPSTQVIEIGKLPNLAFLPARGDCPTCPHHDHKTIDLHVWLDPILMKDVVDVIIMQLTQIDPSQAQRYQENGLAVHKMLDNLDQELHIQFDPIQLKKYMIFHDSYQYLEKRYGLQKPFVIALNHHHAPSAKKMTELKKQIHQEAINCIFVEPQLPMQQAKTLAEAAKIKMAILDPLGSTEPRGPNLYPIMLRTLAKTMTDCLK